MVFTLSVLIVASRKHYTVDVLIAWYVVPLVFYAMLRRWTTKRPLHEEPWPHRSLAEDNALQLEEVVVHGTMTAPEVGHHLAQSRHCWHLSQSCVVSKLCWIEVPHDTAGNCAKLVLQFHMTYPGMQAQDTHMLLCARCLSCHWLLQQLSVQHTNLSCPVLLVVQSKLLLSV